MIDSPVLVLADLEPIGAPGSAGRDAGPGLPTGPALELLTAARALTSSQVVALVLAQPGPEAARALAAAGADRLLVADIAQGMPAALAAPTADALVAAARQVAPGVILVVSDYRGKEAAGRAAIALDSACVSDATELSAVDGELHASKLVLSGSWATTVTVAPSAQGTPIICLRPGTVDAVADEGRPLPAPEPLEVVLSPEAAAVELVSHEEAAAAAGPSLSEARTVVVGGRGVDGDFALVRSLADPLGAAVGATRVACDEGWIERSAQIGQTGETISPRLYIGLGVSGAIHHTSGIQGAGTIVAITDDSEAPILEMADYGVIGDVAEVVPQLVEELERLRG
ncbi:electron transfer flavoprotein subunit alpha/FixB family protein [Actinomyces bowdenii]|uniref:electron transfer flavoprotein subunit alpha/FixB family protein n=1 Tax=Actinomyces bowdenii TaxID=131109 RepID=UPI001ABD3FDC|nr:electron transfer flavoprotein subunit alpha/FixB family protein [Actinomyces bowdenii]MBO3724897.1 electron transfer flavoprotein subunit alpha/FixB family protein [Actinomyces bowdenii]